MTCKECIHEKVCDALIKSGCPYLDKEIPADAFCMEFRNTADVVPKSEVEKFAEEIKLEFYREFDEIIPSIMADKITELKKKYTEETK